MKRFLLIFHIYSDDGRIREDENKFIMCKELTEDVLRKEKKAIIKGNNRLILHNVIPL